MRIRPFNLLEPPTKGLMESILDRVVEHQKAWTGTQIVGSMCRERGVVGSPSLANKSTNPPVAKQVMETLPVLVVVIPMRDQDYSHSVLRREPPQENGGQATRICRHLRVPLQRHRRPRLIQTVARENALDREDLEESPRKGKERVMARTGYVMDPRKRLISRTGVSRHCVCLPVFCSLF